MVGVRTSLQARYDSAKTLPGTRRFHHFKPVNVNTIEYKEVSSDSPYLGSFSFSRGSQVDVVARPILRVNEYVACTYDSKWWIGVVCELNDEEDDCFISFLHPAGPSASFVWPPRKDVCWIARSDVICTVQVPSTRNGRTYTVENQSTIQDEFRKKTKKR